jgi:hypothetical protein
MESEHKGSDAKEALRHKLRKDRLALGLCSNTAGHMGKNRLNRVLY